MIFDGSTKSIRKLPNVRMLKVERCTGGMKRHWSIQTSEGAVLRQKERRRSCTLPAHGNGYQ